MRLALALALALVGTLLLGALLRWQLAGVSIPWTFAHARHAHSHLGFFAVLFPLAWAAWRAAGARTPGNRALVAYAAAVVVATVGFLAAGYSPPSHAGSGVVLAVWLSSAYANRARVSLTARDWLAPAPVAIVLSAAIVPAIAIYTSRDLELATRLVRAFLALLVYAVFVPAALSRLGVRAPVSGAWLVAAVAAAAFTGLHLHPVLGLGLVALAAHVLVEVLRARRRMPRSLVALWLGAALPFALMGAGLVPLRGGAAVAGVHYLALGPLLVSFVGATRETPSWLRVSWAALTSAMAASIWGMDLGLSPLALQRAAALSGTGLLALALVEATRRIGRHAGWLRMWSATRESASSSADLSRASSTTSASARRMHSIH